MVRSGWRKFRGLLYLIVGGSAFVALEAGYVVSPIAAPLLLTALGLVFIGPLTFIVDMLRWKYGRIHFHLLTMMLCVVALGVLIPLNVSPAQQPPIPGSGHIDGAYYVRYGWPVKWHNDSAPVAESELARIGESATFILTLKHGDQKVFYYWTPSDDKYLLVDIIIAFFALFTIVFFSERLWQRSRELKTKQHFLQT